MDSTSPLKEYSPLLAPNNSSEMSVLVIEVVESTLKFSIFKLSPNSPNNPVEIKESTNILVYCAGGYRSALAAKALQDLGFKNVFNIGGFADWVNSGGEIVK